MKCTQFLFCSLLAIICALITLASIVPAIAGIPNRCDLDVTYISRTPRYDRYNVSYSYWVSPTDPNAGQPYLDSYEQDKQRWPYPGETVTFTAHIKNQGKASSQVAGYKWYMDGVQVASGNIPVLAIGAEATVTYNWTWDSEQNTHLIKFSADPSNSIVEENETNNSREDPTNALSFRIHVWQDLYNWFHTSVRTYAPQVSSFDDWIQQQMFYMNKMFKDAVYSTSPNGILERVRIDEIIIEPNSTPDPNSIHAPDDWQWDGRWGFTNNEYLNNPDYGNYFLVNAEQTGYLSTFSPILLHELSHQCGMIDLYQFNIEGDNWYYPIPDQILHTNTRENCLMNRCNSYYSDHTAYAFNSNLHKRRGYFGEFLYDIPNTCRVRLVDAYYRPIPNATIKFRQDTDRTVYNSTPTFVGVTDAAGYYTIPNRPSYNTQPTGTGHVLHDNPWGLINVLGRNGDFFCEITANGNTDYQYMEVLPFNMAYAAGHKDTYTYDLQCNIVADDRPTTNDLYGVKMVSTNLGYAVGAGGTILKWDGNTWTAIPSPIAGATYRSVDANNDGVVCAVGDNGAMAVFSNGSWTSKTPSSGINLTTCVVLSSNTIVAGNSGGQVLRSTDRGQNWTIISGFASINSMRFWDQNRGVMVTTEPKAYYTNDGGASWTAATGAISGFQIRDCSVSGSQDAWAGNDYGLVYRSSNGGVTWSVFADFGWTTPWYSIDMTGNGNGWAVGNASEIYKTTTIKRFENYRWVSHTVNTYGANSAFYDVSSVNDNEAWAVGKGGLILHLVANVLGNYAHGNIAQTTSQADGKTVSVKDATVTASFPGAVYVESSDRSIGMKVKTSLSATPGDVVQVTGILGTEGLERVVQYGDLIKTGNDPVDPLGMNSKFLTGSKDDDGVKTIPLLIRVWGKVSAFSSNWVTVDDGSGRVDSQGNKGIKVILPSTNSLVKDDYVAVTGISSYETVSGTTYPLIRARNANDITKM